MVLITNVLVNVKAILDIATVTIKIHAPVVPLVHLAQLALMEITAQMDAKAKLDRKVVVKDSNVHQDLLDVKNALMDPKDQTDPLDLLVNVDPSELSDQREAQDVMVASDHKERLDPSETKAKLDPKETQDSLAQLVCKEPVAQKVHAIIARHHVPHQAIKPPSGMAPVLQLERPFQLLSPIFYIIYLLHSTT